MPPFPILDKAQQLIFVDQLAAISVQNTEKISQRTDSDRLELSTCCFLF